jgi:hypothetical protein
LWARGEAIADSPMPGDGTVTAEVGQAWRAILLRRPRWHVEAELRRNYEAAERATVREEVLAELGAVGHVEAGGAPGAWGAAGGELRGEAGGGEVAVDLAEIDARPAEATATDSLLAIVGRDGTPGLPLSAALARLPAYSLVARRYRRLAAPTSRG